MDLRAILSYYQRLYLKIFLVVHFTRIFFFYGNDYLHIKHKNNSHLAPWLLWMPGIQKKKM